MDFRPWPFAAKSFNYYPAEVGVQVPMEIFRLMIEKAPEDQRPDWTEQALESHELFILIRARTFYDLLGNPTEPPQYMMDYIEAEEQAWRDSVDDERA